MSDEIKNQLWVEKYRPDNLDDVIGNEKIIEDFKEMIEQQSIDNVLLEGPAGTGKTTIAKILVNKIAPNNHLYLNASDKNSVDNVRNDIIQFASSVGFGGQKIVFLDEIDYFSPNAQGALRNPLSEFSDTTRFIMTANYRDKLIDPIQSRLNIYTVKPMNNKKMANYAVDILKKENVDFEVEDVVEIVKSYSPDLRKIVKTLQKHSRNGKLDLGEGELISESYKTEILKLLFDDDKNNQERFKEIRQIVANTNINRFEELYSYIYDNIHKMTDNTLDYYIKLSEYMYRDSIVVDKEINFMGMISDMLEG